MDLNCLLLKLYFFKFNNCLLVNSSDFSSLSSAGAETLKQRLTTATSTPSSHPSSNPNLCRNSNLTTSSLHTNSPSQDTSNNTSQFDKQPNSVVVLLAEKLDKVIF